MYLQCVLLFIIASCVSCTQIKLNCTQIKALVDGHNTKRLLLARGRLNDQPAASEMKWMTWDTELAKKAQAWAAKQKYVHNTNKEIASGRFRTGENLYLMASSSKTTPFNVKNAIEQWWAEHEQFTYAALESDLFGTDTPIGHYTQMAWANSIYIGCGASTYKEGGYYKTLLVCNYGPCGNVIGQTPYSCNGTKAKKLTCEADAKVCPPVPRYGASCS